MAHSSTVSRHTSAPQWDEMDAREDNAVLTANPLKLKLLAMRLRHRAHGTTFRRNAHGSPTWGAFSYASGSPTWGAFSYAKSSDRALLAFSAAQSDASAQSSGLGGPESSGELRVIAKSTTPEDCEMHQGVNNLAGLTTIFVHPFSIMLVCIPLGILSHHRGWGDMVTFWLNFAALVPLAKILGDATEELAAGLQNDTVSGLLNATFGNAVEMIVSVQSIRAGLLSIVKQSLLGSVLSNILLVLGTAFLAGGITDTGSDIPSARTWSINSSYLKERESSIKFRPRITLEKEQKFPVKAAQVSIGLLFLACMSFALPSIFSYRVGDDSEAILQVSRIGSIIIGSSYVAFLFFTMITHSKTLQKDEIMGATGEDDEDEEGPGISVVCSLLLMAATTVVVTLTSDALVAAISNLVGLDSESGGGSSKSVLPAGFIGVILLPIAGNACEHAGAIRFAMQDKPGLAIGIAVGSSTQVALLVVPFSVIVGWIVGQPMDLNFGVMDTVVMLLTVAVLQAVVMDGRSNWMKGYMLVAAYLFIGVLYWFLPPRDI